MYYKSAAQKPFISTLSSLYIIISSYSLHYTEDNCIKTYDSIHCTSSQSCSLLFKNLVVQPSSQQNTLFLLVRLPIFCGGISASIETSAIISCPLKSGSHLPRLKIIICSGRGNWKWQWKRFLLSPFSLSLQKKTVK